MFVPCRKKVALLRFLLPLLFMCFIALQSYAQERGKVKIQLMDSVLNVNNEELKDVTIRVENKGTETFRGTLHLYCGKGAKVATKQDVPVSVDAGKSLFIPAKVYVGATTLEGFIPYSAQLFDVHNTRIGEATAKLHLVASRNMRATLNEHELIMHSVGSLLQVPVLVSNRGNKPQEVNIVISYPTELQDKTNKSIKLEVPPFKDTLIYFSRKVSRSMMNMEYMDISVYGVYSSGDYFGITSASIQSLKSFKKFGRRRVNNSSQTTGNFVSIGTQNSFSDNQSYFLQTKGDYAIRDGNVSFSFNMFKWKAQGMPTLVNDTWLGFEYKGMGIKVGNITQNGELSYNGRGAEMYYYTDSSRHNKIYAGYLDKSFNLINSQYGNASFGKAAWAGMIQQYGNVRNNTTVSYDEDNFVQSKSVLVVNEATMQMSDLFFASVKAGAASSASSGEQEEKHESFSAGASFNGNISKSLSVSSDNVYASGYYPGTRRGTLSLNEKINLRLDKTTLSAGYMYNYLNPKYFRTGGTTFRNDSKSSTADISAARSFGGFSLSISPQYYQEEGNWYLGGNITPGSMKSFRLSTSASYANVAIRQNILLRFDVGQYTTNFNTESKWQFRANFSYSFNFFRLTANIQQGNFYLSEAFLERSGGQSKLRVNISPSVTGSFFNNRLKADAGLTYYKDFFVSSVLYNASLNCNLGTTRVFATMQYNTFASSSTYRNLQFGLTQLLPQSGKNGLNNKGEIDLFVFYDVNGNGSYDGKDSAASGYLASIGKTLLITNKGGHIVYSKLPAADYKVFFPTQKGWYGPDQFVVLKDKEEATLQVPLRQTGTVSGKITYEFDELLSYSTLKELAGQTITAINEEGKIFEAKTDDNGQFIVYLPTGKYTMTVSSASSQIEVIPVGNNHQPLTVKSGEIFNGANFTLKVKQRKIEIKKFGQN
jgi:hypothetical protein